MNVRKVVVGTLEENCYILEKNGEVLIVDPGDCASKILENIEGKNVLGILITHRHFDHIGALDSICDVYGCPVYEYKNVKEGVYHIGPFTFTVLYTKGHSADSVTYYFEEEACMFVGDFIFKGSIGRCDLEGGTVFQMQESLEKVQNYPNVKLYTGHGEETTLDFEKKNNVYFTSQNIGFF